MEKIKYVIIGQGIAGTILSMKMFDMGIDHIVADSPILSTSSKVAAGLINPIVLKRFKMVQNGESFLEHAYSYYPKWEKNLDMSFFHSLPIHHIFSSQENQNTWMEKSAHLPFSKFLADVIKPASPIKAPFGVGIMNGASWIDTQALIGAYSEFLKNKGLLREISVLPPEEELSQKLNTHKIIWCIGHLQKEFTSNEKIFSPTRGEVLIIKAPGLDEQQIYHAGVFILPLGNNLYKVGATYHWDNFNDIPTKEGKDKLIHELDKILSIPYSIVDHKAGVRPNISDRKPIMGALNQQNMIFNGLGSRGALMAPLLADIFLDFLENDKPLPKEYNIDRFNS